MQYTSIEQIKRANKTAGHHWFDADTMRSFRCRVGDTVYGGHYFISSEQFVSYYPSYHTAPRAYTVRYANTNGTVDTVGEFNAYETRDAALRAIKGYLKQEEEQGHAEVTCTSCKGTGEDIQYDYKGQPTGETRVCWRCKGSGHTIIEDKTQAE